MPKKKRGNSIGGWAFLIGVVLAIVFGLGFAGGVTSNIALALAVIGIIVGLFNIADAEAKPFLLSGAVLIIAGIAGNQVAIPYLGNVLDALLMIFIPATIVVAIRNVMSLAQH